MFDIEKSNIFKYNSTEHSRKNFKKIRIVEIENKTYQSQNSNTIRKGHRQKVDCSLPLIDIQRKLGKFGTV